MWISLLRRPRLLFEEDCVCVVYSPSTMLASGGVATTASATVSAWGRGADSSAAGAESSSATAALGSSSSQDKSVDFLHSTQLVVNQVRLPNHMYYSGKIFTYKLDRKYAGDADKSSFSRRLFFGFSSRWLFSSSCCRWLSPALSNWRLRHSFCHGGGWAEAPLSRLPHSLPVAFVPLVYGVGRRNLLQAIEFCCQHTQHRETSTRLVYSRSLPLAT
jgi:hypothetical protein